MHPAAAIRTFDRLLQLGLLAPVLVGGFAAYGLVVAPLETRARAAQERVAQLEHLLRAAPAVRREYAELRRQLADLESRADSVRQRIPDGPEEAAFLEQLHQAAEAAGLTLDDYRRGNAIRGSQHAQLEVHITGAGSHEAICRFFDQLRQFPRQTQTQHLAIREASEGAGYEIRLTLLLFYRSSGGSNEARRG